MKYFNRSAFISHFNIFNSISAVTGMNEFLTLQLPTVEGNGVIHCWQAFTSKNFCSLSKVMFFIILILQVSFSCWQFYCNLIQFNCNLILLQFLIPKLNEFLINSRFYSFKIFHWYLIADLENQRKRIVVSKKHRPFRTQSNIYDGVLLQK